MPLFLAEITPPADVEGLLALVQSTVAAAGGDFIEAQVTADRGRVFVIVDTSDAGAVQAALAGAGVGIDALDQVRLVGANLADIKENRPPTGYLVEWDIPAGITMDAYLARKKEKSPLYAQVPETTFQRTYVREDMMKCLCFYDAPDEAAVVRAREVVSTPIDRLHKLDSSVVARND